jgi:hypothetical protein
MLLAAAAMGRVVKRDASRGEGDAVSNRRDARVEALDLE